MARRRSHRPRPDVIGLAALVALLAFLVAQSSGWGLVLATTCIVTIAVMLTGKRRHGRRKSRR